MPTIRSVGPSSSSTDGIAPGLPPDVVVGDVLVMFVESSCNGPHPTPPFGWTETGDSPLATTFSTSGDDAQLSVFWTRYVTDPVRVVADVGDHLSGQVVAVSGCADGDPWDATAGITDRWSTTKTVPSLTTTVDGALILTVVGSGRNATSVSGFSGWANPGLEPLTEWMDFTNTAGSGGGIGMAAAIQAVAGLTDPTTVTAHGLPMCLWSGALKPAGPGAIDVTDTINQRIVDAVPGDILQFPPGDYYTPRTVQIVGKSYLRIEAEGAVFWSDTKPIVGPAKEDIEPVCRHVDIRDSSDITIVGLTAKGANSVAIGDKPGRALYDPQRENEHGFSIGGSQRITLEDCTTLGQFGDGVYVGGGFYPPASDVSIIRHTVIDNGRQGMAVSEGSNILIDTPAIMNSRRSGIDLEPNFIDDVVDNVEISGGTIRAHLLAFPVAGRGQVNNVHIHDVTIESSGIPWIYVSAADRTRRHGWRIENCTVPFYAGSTAPTVLFRYTDGIAIVGNEVNFNPLRDMTAIDMVDCAGTLTVRDNCFRGAGTVITFRSWDGGPLLPYPGVDENNQTVDCNQPTTFDDYDIVLYAPGTTEEKGTGSISVARVVE